MKTFLITLFVLTLLFSCNFIGFASAIEAYVGKVQTYVGPHSDSAIQYFSKEADLIFEGRCTAIGQLLATVGEKFIDARAQHGIKYNNVNEMLGDLRWLVTFKIDKTLKGEVPEDKSVYSILVHSPGTTFGLDIDKDKTGSDKKYRIYVKLFPEKAQGEMEENILLAAEAVK